MVYQAAFYTIYVDVNYLFRLIGYSYTPCRNSCLTADFTDTVRQRVRYGIPRVIIGTCTVLTAIQELLL